MALCGSQINFSMFKELYGCCSQQWDPASSLQRTILCLSKRMSSLGICIRLPCPTTQLSTTQSYCWKPCLETRDHQMRFHFPLLGVLTRITFIDSRKFQLYKVSTPPSTPSPISGISLTTLYPPPTHSPFIKSIVSPFPGDPCSPCRALLFSSPLWRYRM